MVWFSKKDYFLQLASNLKNSSKFWKNFKYLSSRKKVQHQPDFSVTYEDINHHIAEKLRGHTYLLYHMLRNVMTCHQCQVSVQDVAEYISKLDTKKAVGVDGISTKFI